MSAPAPAEQAQKPRSQVFRANVGIAVLNSDGQVLALERHGYAGSWQMPQGGVDLGEEPIDAARRELHEETGLRWDEVKLLGEHPEWLAYELERDERTDDIGRGQVQKWFYVRLVDQAATLDLGGVDERKGTPEFTAYAWMTFADLLGKAVPFRLSVYRRVAQHASTLADTDYPPLRERETLPRTGYLRLVIAGSSRAASQRLAAALENFEADFKYRLGCNPELRATPWDHAIRSGLETVHAYLYLGQIDTAWRCFTSVARRELAHADEEELVARANALRHEAAAKKMAPWRIETVLELLDRKAIEEQPPAGPNDVRRRVTEAARIRDEDADNRYYRVALIRGQRSLLLVGLIINILIVLGLTALVDWRSDVHDPSAGFIGLVIGFGALGAFLSAIQSLGRVGVQGRIPEHVASSLITITRPALGAAAALGVYAIASSGILNITVSGDEAHLTVLALAFAAGFSERLVLSAVGAATGATDQKPGT